MLFNAFLTLNWASLAGLETFLWAIAPRTVSACFPLFADFCWDLGDCCCFLEAWFVGLTAGCCCCLFPFCCGVSEAAGDFFDFVVLVTVLFFWEGFCCCGDGVTSLSLLSSDSAISSSPSTAMSSPSCVCLFKIVKKILIIFVN